MTQTTFARTLALAGLACASAAVIGCQGHGSYTTEGISLAQERMSQIKSGTTWDMARQQFVAGDLRKALQSVDQSLSINENVPKSHSLKGRILVELGELEVAVESFKKALAIDPTFVEAHYHMGVVYERFRDVDGALEKFRAASELDPSNVQYVIAAAEMLIEQNRLEEAESMLQGERSRFEHNAGVRQTLGHIAMMRGEMDRAVSLFSEARMLAPDEPGIVEDLALSQIAAGRFAEAEYSIRKLLDRPENKDRRDLRHARARCLMRLDRPVEARAVLLELTSDDKGQGDVNAWIDLGEVAMVLGDLNRVRIVANRLRTIAPKRGEGHVMLAMAERLEGDLEGALKSLDAALAIKSEDPTAHLLRGVVLEEMGRSGDAANAFARAAALDPQSKTASRLMAIVNPED